MCQLCTCVWPLQIQPGGNFRANGKGREFERAHERSVKKGLGWGVLMLPQEAGNVKSLQEKGILSYIFYVCF